MLGYTEIAFQTTVEILLLILDWQAANDVPAKVVEFLSGMPIPSSQVVVLLILVLAYFSAS